MVFGRMKPETIPRQYYCTSKSFRSLASRPWKLGAAAFIRADGEDNWIRSTIGFLTHITFATIIECTYVRRV